MKVLALTQYGRLGASSRMRFLQYFPMLGESGIEVYWSPLLKDDYLQRLYAGKSKDFFKIFYYYMARLFLLLKSRSFDFVWIEKEIFPGCPAWAEKLFSLFGISYVVDYDDAVFHNYNNGVGFWQKLLRKKIEVVMQCATLVVCGNDYIKKYALVAGARRVEIIPTVVDLARYPEFSGDSSSPVKGNKKIIIGWMGSPSTTKYINNIIPALRELSNHYSIQLLLIGAKSDEIKLDGDENFQIDFRAWLEADEVSSIKEFDIGVMPLADAPWAHGKCGYKLIQYMACGIPCIASPIGINKKIIDQEMNGYLADSLQEWVSAFRHLIDNPKKRCAFGKAGRRQVEVYYSLQVTAPYLVSLFKPLAKNI